MRCGPVVAFREPETDCAGVGPSLLTFVACPCGRFSAISAAEAAWMLTEDRDRRGWSTVQCGGSIASGASETAGTVSKATAPEMRAVRAEAGFAGGNTSQLATR
ncbi:MAG: hypothetical protein QOG97_2219 [Acidimicrobiaceae bacterium]|nr:hypothetical protein [Acidimicrobiaceae bacterium]